MSAALISIPDDRHGTASKGEFRIPRGEIVKRKLIPSGLFSTEINATRTYFERLQFHKRNPRDAILLRRRCAGNPITRVNGAHDGEHLDCRRIRGNPAHSDAMS